MAGPPSRLHALDLKVPLLIEAPPQMKSAVRDVLAGEYESGFDGEALTVLDIGANVGSFSIWAHHRWPRSRIVAFEPNPQTFAMLEANVRALGNVECVNAAVFPGTGGTIEFFSRYPGDGEAGIAETMKATFAPGQDGELFEVAVVDPGSLPAADVVKLDVEGAEADILAHIDLSGVSLVLLEYQNQANRAAIKALMSSAFELVREDEFAWDELLWQKGYRRDLKGDKYGHMFFVARANSKLRSRPPEPPRPDLRARLVERLRRLLRIA